VIARIPGPQRIRSEQPVGKISAIPPGKARTKLQHKYAKREATSLCLHPLGWFGFFEVGCEEWELGGIQSCERPAVCQWKTLESFVGDPTWAYSENRIPLITASVRW
jgi:hypothetical protein